MKKRLFISVIVLLHFAVMGQCYEPNIRKADAEYANGNWSLAYEYYRNASKCPDAKLFENGKLAKAGMQKCKPVLKIDGQKELYVTVGREAGERTFKVISSRLDSRGWEVSDEKGCEVVNTNHQSNTITIKWQENKFIESRSITFSISGSGVEYVRADVTITQQGYPDEIVTLPQGANYDTVRQGSSGISFVLYHGKYGFVDSTGKPITPLKYTYVKKTNIKHGETETYWGENVMLMRVYHNGKYGYIDCKGNEVVPLEYDFILQRGLEYGIQTTVVGRNGKYGLLNGAGKEVISCIYDSYEGGCAREKPVAFGKNGKYAFFDYEGKQLTDFRYNSVGSGKHGLFFGYNGLCRVEVNGKYGYVNMKGEEVVLPQYEYALDFGGNRAMVRKGEKSGFINSQGDLVIPYKYNYDYSGRAGFSGSVGLVKDGGEYIFIDSMGNPLTDKRYKSPGDGNMSIYVYDTRLRYDYYTMRNIGTNLRVDILYGIIESEDLFEEKIDTTDLKEAALKGIPEAKLDLAKIYYRLGDKNASYRWALEAAPNGSSAAKTYLAKKIYYGDGCQINYKFAYDCFKKSAEMGDDEAMRYLAWMLWYGEGCSKDRQEAEKWERKAMLAGNETAYRNAKKLGMDISDLKPF